MKQNLYTGFLPLYSSTNEAPNEIRLRIRMRDLIDATVLRKAVDTTMERYPYFCVELQRIEGEYAFVDNPRPVVISNSSEGVALNSKSSNYHMIAFSWFDNWIILDVFHGLTDATGAYEVIRTLLYYYCSERYGVRLKDEGIRLVGDDILPEEWIDPVEAAGELPSLTSPQMSKALNLMEAAGLQRDPVKTVYSIAIHESEFMRFNVENDGSPGTMVALFLSKAFAKMYPKKEDAIRIMLCVNQRKAFNTPLAHQNLVGAAMLEYKEQLKSWPLYRQATAYRGMVFVQSREEAVLSGANNLRGISQMLMSKKSNQERQAIAAYIGKMSGANITASVSYVGKANFREAEKYIRDFRTWTDPSGIALTAQISAVNGCFGIDIIQAFSSPIYVNAFLDELDENGITYDLKDVAALQLPIIQLSWNQ